MRAREPQRSSGRALLFGVTALLFLTGFLVFTLMRRDTRPMASPKPRAPAASARRVVARSDRPALTSERTVPLEERSPEGTLRLEGQVIEADGEPVGDATVIISTVPPR